MPEQSLFLSVATIAEMRLGVERMSPGARRVRITHWLDEVLPRRFQDNILPVDIAVADLMGRLAARRLNEGRPMEAMDLIIAATAEVHNLTLVTRNVSHFEGAVTSILNPWTRT